MKYINSLYIWTDNHSEFLMTIFTIVLVIITAISIFFTAKMARVSSAQMDLELRPYVSFERDLGFIVKEKEEGSTLPAEYTDFLRVKYSFVNLGKVPAVYKVDSISFNNVALDFSARDIVLYPGQTIFFTTPTIKISTTKTAALCGKIKVKMVYWGLSDKSKIYFNTRTFSIDGPSSYYIENDEAGLVS